MTIGERDLWTLLYMAAGLSVIIIVVFIGAFVFDMVREWRRRREMQRRIEAFDNQRFPHAS